MVIYKPDPKEFDRWDPEVHDTYFTILTTAIEMLEDKNNQDEKLDLLEVEEFMKKLADKSMPSDFDLTMDKMKEMGALCRLVDFIQIPTDKEQAFAVAGDLVLEYVFIKPCTVREAQEELQRELNNLVRV